MNIHVTETRRFTKPTATSSLTNRNKNVILYLDYFVNFSIVTQTARRYHLSEKRAAININKGRIIRESDFGILASTLAVKYKVIS